MGIENRNEIYFIYANNGRIKRTGIESVALGLALPYSENIKFFSVSKNDADIPVIDEMHNLDDGAIIFIFTHLEYAGLRELIPKFKPTFVYVGDWLINYRISLCKWKPSVANRLKVLLGYYRAFKVKGVLKNTTLIYVNKLDCDRSRDFGFKNSVHVPLGHFYEPEVEDSGRVYCDTNIIAFSGNFSYEPNIQAAKLLIRFVQDYPKYKLALIGRSAEIFEDIEFPKLLIYNNVDSIVETLQKIRPIYVAPLFFGAGSKNKLLDAAAARIPIVCTRECLDSEFLSSIGDEFPLINRSNDIFDQIDVYIQTLQKVGWDDRIIYQKVIRERCWSEIARKFSSDLASML